RFVAGHRPSVSQTRPAALLATSRQARSHPYPGRCSGVHPGRFLDGKCQWDHSRTNPRIPLIHPVRAAPTLGPTARHPPERGDRKAMPARRKKERIAGSHFLWLLGQRNGVYYADGRSNKLDAGRHSLGTKDYKEALETLKQLDLVRAVELGLADRAALKTSPSLLSLEEGRRLYLAHVGRPALVGGARPVSVKRYRPVLDKFERFARAEGITSWNQVACRTLEAYAAHLDDEGYAYATEYLELTTLKQVIKWLVEAEHLPSSCLVRLPLTKPQGTTTYCWRTEEVAAMVQFCRDNAE